MTALSPMLFLAGMHQYMDAAQEPDGEVRISWRQRHPADVEFLHRVAMATHRDPTLQQSWWPLRRFGTAAALVGAAQERGLVRRVPEPADVIVLGPEDVLWPGVVASVVRVLEYGVPRGSTARCVIAFTEPDAESPLWMRFVQVTRWCGPARGDVVIRWADWPREVAA